jgi:indolepyruvate ferredoxin oxidoreductase, beta subunit
MGSAGYETDKNLWQRIKTQTILREHNVKTVNLLVVGVGGQGVVAASDIIADMALAKGYDVKKSEIHGMSQRGGAVSSFVRYGGHIASPLPYKNDADFIISFEEMEALRWSQYSNENTKIIVNTLRIKPAGLMISKQEYPDIRPSLKGRDVYYLDGTGESKKIGNERIVNSFMIGAFCAFNDFSADDFHKALVKRVKKYTEENMSAFNKGKEMVKNYVLS